MYFAPMSFNMGDRVKTADELTSRDYTAEGIAQRHPSKTGTIVGQHDSHGLCYDVEYDGGGKGTFDPDELTLVAPATPAYKPTPAEVQVMSTLCRLPGVGARQSLSRLREVVGRDGSKFKPIELADLAKFLEAYCDYVELICQNARSDEEELRRLKADRDAMRRLLGTG